MKESPELEIKRLLLDFLKIIVIDTASGPDAVYNETSHETSV